MFGAGAGQVLAQDSNPESNRESVLAERFLQVLIRRPRLGTALDRVYGFHVQNGSLDELIESLDVPKDSPDAPQRKMIVGLIHLQRGMPALAVQALSEAETMLPEDAACSYSLGRAHLAIGQIEEAAAAMERAIDRNPARNEALPVFTELGRIYSRAGLNKKALAVWKKLEALFPGDTRVGDHIARTLAEEGRVEEALQRYQTLAKSSRREEDKISFSVKAAELQRRLGQMDMATEQLEQILAKLRPGSWLYSDVRNRIEQGFLKSGDFDALADYYKKRLSQSPDDLQIQVRLCRILISAGRLDEAKRSLQRVLERAPDDPDVRLSFIDVLVRKGEVDAAAEQYENLVKRHPGNPDYLLQWGQILIEDTKRSVAERRNAAAAVWQRLADARATDAVMLSQVADRMRSIERSEDAIDLYQKAIEVDPESPQYREYLGEYLNSLDRKQEAIEAWESIAADGRRNRESLVRLAEIYSTFKMPERALASWREASEFDLTFGQELRFATILREATRFDEALERLDAAKRIAETPDEKEQLLRDWISTYEQAGTLSEQIAKQKRLKPTGTNLRTLAMMHQAAGQLTDAESAIRRAIEAAPDDVDALIVAADIAERQNRFSDAAEMFQKLSTVDTRFRTNHLQRVADLQLRLGQVDEALVTCESLIDANPASPESYQFLARMAFRSGRDEQAIIALRRAMNIAPRDNSTRRMLASTFAERYRTDEAIELYWQAMEYESEADDRIALVRQLAPLYDRKGDLDSLIRRIEDRGREDEDVRTTLLMISAGYEAVQDFGAAKKPIETLLTQQPRNVSLLETMVNLCDAADEVGLAAEFQERIVALADTPDNRFQLVQLKLDAGMIDVASALNMRIALEQDPVRLGGMIRSAMARGDVKAATSICRAAIRRDSSLWDVKLFLAQLLLYETGEESKPLWEEAIRLSQEVRNGPNASDDRPPTARPIPAGMQPNGRPSNVSFDPRYWSQSSYQLSRNYRLGRYRDPRYSSLSINRLVEPQSFGHARLIAAALQMVVVAKEQSGNDLKELLEQRLLEEYSLGAIEEIDDANVIWEYLALRSIVSAFTLTTTRPTAGRPDDDLQRLNEKLYWRLAQLDPINGSSGLLSLLRERVTPVVPPGSEPSNSTAVESVDPLSEDQLEQLVALFEKSQARSNSAGPASTSQTLTYRMILFTEFLRSGQPDLAASYALPPPEERATLSEIMGMISGHLQLGQIDHADALVGRLLPAARMDRGGNTPSPSASSIAGTAAVLMQGTSAVPEFVDRHRMELLDALLANAIRNNAASRSRASGLSNGTLRAYRRTSTNSYTATEVKAPLAASLLSQSMITELVALLPPPKGEQTVISPQARKLNVPSEVIDHLRQPLANAPPRELKSRQTLAAFAHWWADRPTQCYEILIELCEKYPDDVDLQIERARLASELGKTRIALDTLDSFDPLDSQMLVRKEMAAMNLASKLGDLDRAKRAAERLFGMRMDTATQMALADQLQRLGMKDKASAVLRRLRGGRSRSESTEIQIANSFLASDDKESAGEVAYALLRRLNSGRGRTSSNQDYYRQQAVSILQTVDRLDPLIAQAKRRLESSPTSTRARSELAELYSAAGRDDDASRLWEEVAEEQPNDPRQMLARAEALSRARRYKDAAFMYLDLFKKQPQLFERNYSKLTRAAQQGNCVDEMFARLLEFSPESLPMRRISSMVRVGGSSNYSEAKRKFISHVLKSSYAKANISSILRSIPESEQANIPELREVLIDAACSADAFSPTSGLWRVSSYSRNGTANGSLSGVIQMLIDDEVAADRFEQAAAKAKEDSEQARTADFLLALLAFKKDDHIPEAASTIRKQLEIAKPDQPEAQVAISGGLLWQAGQILESLDDTDEHAALLVAIYEGATRDSTSRIDDIRYSVVTRLLNAYVKNDQHLTARRYLLDMYANTDNSAQNQYNPGYGDYQDLQAYQAIADKLVEMNFPIDALAIYRQASSKPARFENAKRWGNDLSISQIQQSEKAAVEKVNPERSAAHLARIADDLGSDSMKQRERSQWIDLLDVPISALLASDVKSGIRLAIESASTTDEGRRALREFDQALLQHADQREADWSIPAARMIVAAHMQPDRLPELASQLKACLPARESISAAVGTPQASKYRPLTALYSVAAVILQHNDLSDKVIGTDLVAYLRTVAKTIGEPEFEIALSVLTGDDSESLIHYLTTIEAVVEREGNPSHDQINTCLQIAKSSAVSGDILLSTRALKLALGNGPPLRQIGVGGDAFAINTNASVNSQQVDNKLDELIQRVNELVDLYSDATGHQLGARPPEVSSDQKPKSDNDLAMNAIVDAFQAVVLPENRDDSVFPYAKTIASTSYSSLGSASQIVPESLSIAMSRAAALSNRSKDLIDLVRSRMEQGTDNSATAGVLVDLAFAAEDSEVLAEALARFAKSVDAELPEKDAKSKVPTSGTVITIQVQNDTARKTQTINLVMNTVWPLVNNPHFPPAEILVPASDLLARTAQLIDSDSYTSSRHREISTHIRKAMMDTVLRRRDEDGFQEILRSELNTIERRYASYPIDRKKTYRARAMEDLLLQLLSAGWMDQTPQLIRQMALDNLDGHRDLRNLAPASLGLALNRLPKERRLELLKRITLGEDDDDPVVHWGSFVRYTKPPSLVARQVPRLSDMENLPTCDPNVPFISTLLMLADLAAELDQSAQVIEALAARSRSVGDESDLAATLVRLAANRANADVDGQTAPNASDTIETLDATLSAISQNLAENKPTKTDESLRFPELSLFVVVRAIAAGLPPERYESLLQDLQTYAFRSKSYLMMSSISRLKAALGLGNAAGARSESPLQHFAIVSVPTQYGPDVSSMTPQYTIDDSGLLSGTSGYYVSMLMLRYPVTGSFEISADIHDGNWGECNVAYGGVLYKPTGVTDSAKLYVLGRRGDITFPISSITKGQFNIEAIRVTGQETVGRCNGVDYATDITTSSYPWPAISHFYYRTTKLRDIKITGEPKIPREVNMIDPTMRGWGILTTGRGLPDPMLPVGPNQDAQAIARKRTEAAANREAKWSVKDGELSFKSASIPNAYDPPSHIQYLRPLLDGESVEMSFWWEWGSTEVHPSIGRTVLQLDREGVIPTWISTRYDLGHSNYVAVDQLDPPAERLARDNVPIDQSWNSIKMTRSGDVIAVMLNDKPLLEFPITEPPRPGVMRNDDRDVRIRSIKLTGDWPTEFPADLMKRTSTNSEN